jgi:hypothetical protein
MNKEAIIILRDIVKNQLSLTNDQIWLFNQDYKIPQTSGIFITLESVSKTPFSNNNRFVLNDTEDGIDENQYTNIIEEIAIDLFSKNRDAQIRQHEVIMAFDSYYGREQQEIYQFKIAKINQPFLNISEVEGTGMLNRFRLTVIVHSWQSRKAAVPFYDNNFTPTTFIDPETV